MRKIEGCKKNELRIGKKCYPRVTIQYAGKLKDYHERISEKTLTLINNEPDVENTKKRLGYHPSVREYSGFIVKTEDIYKKAIHEAYGFSNKKPLPGINIFHIQRKIDTKH